MKILHINTSPLDTNTYIVFNDKEAFVVDPGSDADKITLMIKEAGVELSAILLTHAHSDHIGGVAELVQMNSHLKDGGQYPKIFMHADDVALIDSYKNLAFTLNIKLRKFVPDVVLQGGEALKIAGMDVRVLSTPGHTRGGVCYVVEDKIFTGDTVFFMSYGRTDFPEGNFKALKNSIVNKLFRLSGNYTLLPGHGEPTSLEFERQNNPISGDRDFDIITD